MLPPTLRLVITGAVLASAEAGPGAATVIVEDGLVGAVEPSERPVAQRPGDWTIDAAGRLLLPGAVDAHAHPQRLLLRGHGEGLAGSGEPGWARAERALDAADLEAAVRAALCEAALAGTTCLFAHLHAPAVPGEVLERLAAIANEVGIRLVAGLAASDRDGEEQARAAIGASSRFAASPGSGLCRGVVCLEASSGCSDGLLALAADGARHGLHLPVTEHEADLTETFARTGRRVVARLRDAGLLGERTLAAHGTFLDRAEAELLASAGATVVVAPRAGLLAGLPAAPLAMLIERGVGVALGTDSVAPGVLAEGLSALLTFRAGNREVRADGFAVAGILAEAGGRLVGRFFGGEAPAVRPGARADLTLLDYRPTSPVDPRSRAAHLLGPAAGAGAAFTIVEGRVVVREGKLLTVDAAAAAAQARERSAALLRRI